MDLSIQDRALELVKAEPGIKISTLLKRLGINRVRRPGRAQEIRTTLRWMIGNGLVYLTYDMGVKISTTQTHGM